MNPIVIKIHEDEGIRTGIKVGEGQKFVSVIYPDSAGITIRKFKRNVELRITELSDYPIARAKKHLRRCGRNFGITKAARLALK